MVAISSGTDPLYIIGTERSGSNLLRVMLNAHSGIVLPHPPHILRYFSPLEKAYGDFEESENLSRLVSDVLRLIVGHRATSRCGCAFGRAPRPSYNRVSFVGVEARVLRPTSSRPTS